MRTGILTLLCLAGQCQALHAEECSREILKSYAGSGEMVTVSGKKFQIAGQDFIDPNEWLPDQKLIVCLDILQSKKMNEKIYQIKNLIKGETLTAYDHHDKEKDCTVGGGYSPGCTTQAPTQ